MRRIAGAGQRHVCLVDNLPLPLGVVRGRSKSAHLALPLRQITAVLLASGSRLAVRWIPSEFNVADAPSRGWGWWAVAPRARLGQRGGAGQPRHGFEPPPGLGLGGDSGDDDDSRRHSVSHEGSGTPWRPPPGLLPPKQEEGPGCHSASHAPPCAGDRRKGVRAEGRRSAALRPERRALGCCEWCPELVRRLRADLRLEEVLLKCPDTLYAEGAPAGDSSVINASLAFLTKRSTRPPRGAQPRAAVSSGRRCRLGPLRQRLPLPQILLRLAIHELSGPATATRSGTTRASRWTTAPGSSGTRTCWRTAAALSVGDGLPAWRSGRLPPGSPPKQPER